MLISFDVPLWTVVSGPDNLELNLRIIKTTTTKGDAIVLFTDNIKVASWSETFPLRFNDQPSILQFDDPLELIADLESLEESGVKYAIFNPSAAKPGKPIEQVGPIRTVINALRAKYQTGGE